MTCQAFPISFVDAKSHEIPNLFTREAGLAVLISLTLYRMYTIYGNILTSEFCADMPIIQSHLNSCQD